LSAATTMGKKKFVAVREECKSEIWMYIWAYSAEDIEALFPEFWVFEVPPKRFTNSEVAQEYATLFSSDLDHPAEWLQRYTDQSQKHHWYFKNPHLKPPFYDTP
jgi:hypothetical protein